MSETPGAADQTEGRDQSHIVVPEFLPSPQVVELSAVARVTYDPDLYADRPRLLATLSDARAMLIRNRTRVDEQLLGAAGALEVIGRLGVGLDNVDLEEARRRGVTVIPARGGNAVSVAEYVIGAMITLQRGVFAMTDSMLAGEWPRQGHAFGHELMGKVLGLAGLGPIGRAVASRGAGLGMDVIAHDPYLPSDHEAWSLARRVDWEPLLGTADVLSLHIPLDASTIGLMDGAALASMKPGAILINTSRGRVVDENALAASLRAGRLAGAALDVFASEPLGPEAAFVFAGIDNLILTPHISGNTVESVDRVAASTVRSVLDHLGL